MSRFYKTKFLITSNRIYGNDLALHCFTQQLGNITIIAKNAASPKSRRKDILTPGAVLNGSLYYKNHYYLSETELLENYVPFLTTTYQLILFKLILQAIEQHSLTENGYNFHKILDLLKAFKESKDNRAFAITYAVFHELQLVYNINLKCKKCKKSITDSNQASFYQGFLFCNKCIDNKDFGFSLKDKQGQISFFKQLLEFWSI